jgi:predicted nucleic acid-binding protein
VSAYADTSLLISLYTSDSNSDAAAASFHELKDLVIVTPFGESEFVNSVELRVFRKEITLNQSENSLRDFQRDIDVGAFIVGRPVPANAYERAQLLSRRHTRHMGVRGMDVIHVAIALELNAELFFTFDKDQATLAKRAGLTVRPGRGIPPI